MSFTPWIGLAFVLMGGAIGGGLNAILFEGGWKKGYRDSLPTGQSIWRLGWGRNIFVGTTAAFIVWVLYGVVEPATPREFLLQIVGAILTGICGDKALTGHINTRLLLDAKDNLSVALIKEIRKTQESKKYEQDSAEGLLSDE